MTRVQQIFTSLILISIFFAAHLMTSGGAAVCRGA